MAELEQVLSAHTIIGVDTMPFIYLWEKHPYYLPLAQILFRYLDSPQVQGITSIITMIEVCVYPQQQGRLDLVQQYERSLLYSRQVRMLSIDTTLARRAITLRVQYGLRVPDALQIAAALEGGSTLFVTNDSRLRQVREIDILVLNDFSNS